MANIVPTKISIKAQIGKIVRGMIGKTPHDISTHAGFKGFKDDIMRQVLEGFPSEKRESLTKLVEDAITSHGEFHDINREKSEQAEMKKKK